MLESHQTTCADREVWRAETGGGLPMMRMLVRHHWKLSHNITWHLSLAVNARLLVHKLLVSMHSNSTMQSINQSINARIDTFAVFACPAISTMTHGSTMIIACSTIVARVIGTHVGLYWCYAYTTQSVTYLNIGIKKNVDSTSKYTQFDLRCYYFE